MRRTVGSGFALSILAAAAVALCLVPVVAGASLLYQDTFTYPNGNLTSNGGWYAHSSGGLKPIQVAGGQITVVQSTGSGEDDNHPFYVNQGASSKSYVAFKLTIPNGSTIGATDYFLHFRPAPTDTNGFVTRVFLGPPTGGGSYAIGVSSGAIGSTPGATWASDLTFGTTYKVVAEYDGSTGGSQLWINPVNESSTNVNTGASATVVGKPLASIALRQASPSGATDSQVIDDLVVATNFDDANAGPFVPSMPKWAIPGVAALLAAMGALFVVRRRNATV